MSASVRVGQVYVPKPDRDLRYQKIVQAVEGGVVRLAPYRKDRRFPRQNQSSFPLSKFLSCYRLLWHVA